MAATATKTSWIVCDDYANAGLVVAACVHRNTRRASLKWLD